MIAARDAAGPDARVLRACGLAALAEAGILYLPAHLILTESRGIELDVEALALPFVVAYTGAALLACRFRASRSLATAAALLAALAGVTLGGGDVNRSVFVAVVVLLLALRAVALAHRDWRMPIQAELGWGAVALGLETIVASSAEPDWRPLLLVIVPTFFVAALASRASTVWTSGGAAELDDRVRASWIRRAVLGTGAVMGAMAFAAALGGRGGLFDRVGTWLTPVADAIATGFGWLAGQVARPIFWLVDRFGIDPEGVRELLDRLREGGLARGGSDAPAEAAVWQRLLGLLVVAAIGFAVFRLIRLSRARESREERLGAPVEVSTEPIADEVSHSRPTFRRELPADAVRRLYAELLHAVRAIGLTKAPELTPAEFAPRVAERFPECADDVEALTRAYEDVRYGSLGTDPERVRRLRAGQQRLLTAVRSEGLRADSHPE